MKTLPPALAAHYALGSTTLAYALRIQRSDSYVFGFTSADHDVTFDGTVYKSEQGLNISSLEMNSGFSVDNLELSTLDDGTLFSRVDVLGGLWRNAKFSISRYNYAALEDGFEVIMVGTLGEVTLGNGMVKVELRGLQQFFQQPVGAVVSATCRARLGDSLCKVDLNPITKVCRVGSVIDKQTIVEDFNPMPDGYFENGVLVFVGGACDWMRAVVKTHSSNTFVLQLPLVVQPAVGDYFVVTAGCKKRYLEDCIGKFNNGLNFQGEPHVPGIDKITATVGRRGTSSSSGGS